jgi:hypothetical protein
MSAKPSLYDRLGGIYAIAAVVDDVIAVAAFMAAICFRAHRDQNGALRSSDGPQANRDRGLGVARHCASPSSILVASIPLLPGHAADSTD